MTPRPRSTRLRIAVALVLGAVAALAWQAPARWLADAVGRHTDQRLMLADSRGSLWFGSAQVVLTAGPGSRDASRLPGRLHWNWGWSDGSATLRLKLDCCSTDPVTLRVTPSWRGWSFSVPASPTPWARLPANWLSGLGTPFNTLQPQGQLTVGSTQGLKLDPSTPGQPMEGGVQMQLNNLSTRLATVAPLGNYELRLQAPDSLTLETREGAALRLQAQGRWQPRLQMQGQAEAAPGYETALDNLLNIVGRREGARSLITLG